MSGIFLRLNVNKDLYNPMSWKGGVMRKIFVVCLYGLYDSKRRSAIEMRGYQSYLRQCCYYVAKHARHKDAWPLIVLSGGVTTELPISEAESVRPYVHRKLRRALREPFELRLNNDAKDAVGQLRWLRHYLLRPGERCEIVIFCDKVRRFKTHVIASKLLTDINPYWKVVSFPREDIHPHGNWKFQLLATIKLLFKDLRS